MGLNIKNSETQGLVRDLVHLTGENMTQAITVAVRERRERILAGQKVGVAQQLLAIGADCAKRLSDSEKNIDPSHELYGTNGLPE